MTKYQIQGLNDFRSDMTKKREFYESILMTQNKLIEDFEGQVFKLFDEKDALQASSRTLQSQLDQYSDKLSFQELEISKMKSERKVYR